MMALPYHGGKMIVQAVRDLPRREEEVRVPTPQQPLMSQENHLSDHLEIRNLPLLLVNLLGHAEYAPKEYTWIGVPGITLTLYRGSTFAKNVIQAMYSEQHLGIVSSHAPGHSLGC